MKYRDLIQFDPIESVIVLRSADDSDKAAELVRSYVMSDDMAELISVKILSQLRFEGTDNKGVLLVGNYGTGKSHLMSVVSAVASSEEMLPKAQNERFRQDAAPIAGKFEVLRIEIGSTKMSLRNIIATSISKDFEERGLSFTFPDEESTPNNKDVLVDMMAVFAEKYGDDRGYLIVVDELLDYLKSRKYTDLMRDLGFLREIGEIIKSTRFRFISGVQEALFDNATFTQVSQSLLKMKDRFEQVLIRSEDIAYVVKERVLSKTKEQKAMIREHLQQFCPMYQNMATRLEEYVEMFPIHPSYIDTFQHIVTVEKREVLKTISDTIAAAIDTEVNDQDPAIISFDTYWKRIKENPSLRTEPAVREVLSKSTVLESIIQNSFPKALYKPMALKLISALSVHRLTTGTLDAKLGMTEQNLKDDLCLYIQGMPDKTESFLQMTIHNVLQDVMNTVSGQFIEFNPDNGQYYLDLKKDIDYDKQIKDKADILDDDTMNYYFFGIMVSMLNYQETDKYVPGFNIFQYNLNWRDKNIFRRGYLFLGNSKDRPTAEPKEAFWAYIVPPFGNGTQKIEGKKDEVYFTLQPDPKLKDMVKLYGGAREMENLSAAGETKTVYVQRGNKYLSDIRKWMDNNRVTLFRVTYMNQSKSLLESLHGVSHTADMLLKEIIEAAASNSLNPYFKEKYPDYPRFEKPVTVQNMATNRAEALNAIMGRTTTLGTSVLNSFGLLLDGKIRPENSPYAAYYIEKLKKLPEGNVLNYSDIMMTENGEEYMDSRFKLGVAWVSIILTALVYGGYCVLVSSDGKHYDAGNMEALCKISPDEIYNFKRLEKPKSMNRQMLNRIFDDYGISNGLLASETTYASALEALLKAAKENVDAAFELKGFLQKQSSLWSEYIIPISKGDQLIDQIKAVHETGYDIRSRFTTVAKMKNFDYDDKKLQKLEDGLKAMELAREIRKFRDELQDILQYMDEAESKIPADITLKQDFEASRQEYRALRDRLLDEDFDLEETDDLVISLEKLKKQYIEWYMSEHKAYRLDHSESQKKGALLQNPTFKALNTLRQINGILPTSQFTDLQTQLAALKTCYELTGPEMEKKPVCAHCSFNPADNDAKPVHGRIGAIEDKAEDILNAWTKTLKTALEDPMTEDQKKLLGKPAQASIDKFIGTGFLPTPLDQQFIDNVNAILSGLESLEIHMDKLQDVMTSWGPCKPEDFKNKLIQWIDNQLSGKDKSKVRIVIK